MLLKLKGKMLALRRGGGLKEDWALDGTEPPRVVRPRHEASKKI